MPEKTTWEFELLDKASASAGRIEGAVSRLSEGMGKSVFGAELLAKGVEALTEKVIEFGKETVKEMFHAADMGRTNKLVFEAISGSAKGAASWMETVRDVADKTGSPLEEVAGSFKAMANAGFDDTTARRLFAGASDLALKSGVSKDGLVDMFIRIKNEGSLAGRAILGMGRAINLPRMAKELLGVSASERDLKKAMIEGKIAADALLPAIIRAAAGHGRAGDLAVKVADGWEGGLNRVKNAWVEMLEKFGETGGFEAAVDLLKRAKEFLSNPDTIFAFKEGVLDTVAAVQTLAATLKTVWELVSATGKQFNNPQVQQQFDAQPWWMRAIIKAGGGVTPAMEMMGADHAQGYLKGVAGEKGLQAHSPSKAMEELGMYAAEGFANGLESGGFPGVDLPKVSKANDSGARSIALDLTVNVGGGGNHQEARGIALAVKEEVLNALTGAMEELAIEAGA